MRSIYDNGNKHRRNIWMYRCTHSPLEGWENKLRDGNEGNVNAVEKRLEYIRAVNGALRIPTSLRIDVLHSMGLSIRDYSVSPSEQLGVRALPRSPWPIEASASKRGESLHAPDGMPSLLGYGYLKRGRYTLQHFFHRREKLYYHFCGLSNSFNFTRNFN